MPYCLRICQTRGCLLSLGKIRFDYFNGNELEIQWQEKPAKAFHCPFIFFLSFLIYLFIYLFIFGCIGSSLLRAGFSLVVVNGGYSSLWCTGFSLRWLLSLQSMGSRHTAFSSCGTWAQQSWLAGSRAQAQQLWHTGLVAPRHVGSSGTRAQTHVPCIGRRILNHCTTRQVPAPLSSTKYNALQSVYNIISQHLPEHFFCFLFCFLAALGLHCCAGFLQLRGAEATLHCDARTSHWMAFLVAAHGLQACGLQQLWHVGSVVVAHRLQRAGSVFVAHGLSCSAACGIFPDQGLNPCPLH